ncbi:XK-related protein 9 [Microcaecilia unicolor]|uniref:XK-related protein n=1 Tax=Microcaecilia unicolor TaxID=1415580 RepID=A0A6P7YVW6_9AMPH|nr:XK-related protein 9 [Microcaecilia unicolor]XP_030071285.1 XK-related protein 9 [Microcaecilia unicolor]
MMLFTKWNFVMLVIGIITYLIDFAADFCMAVKYFYDGHYIGGAITVAFMLLSTIIVQIFSYTWFKDDCENDKLEVLSWVLLAHIFQAGIFTRYWLALKYGYRAAVYQQSRATGSDDNAKDIQMSQQKVANDAVADLSMLRLFDSFLDSTPQLILQLYILMEHGKMNLFQNASIVILFCSISWSTVHYQMSLRNSLSDKLAIRVGCPMFMYLFYKLFTLTSWAMSVVLLGLVNAYCLLALLILLWILGTSWTWNQNTEFCHSKGMEYLYRVLVGVILVFTFFNIKGQRTKIPMLVYYLGRVFVTVSILCLCWYLKPLVTQQVYFPLVSISAVLGLGLGLICLIFYYGVFHPSMHCTVKRGVDATDGQTREKSSRIRNFVMP